MHFIAATGNAGKLAEFRRILAGMGHTVESQREAGLTLEPEETGATFAENACLKARAICEACGAATLADDSGLCVDALGGAPGVYSARYCGRHGDDEANNDKLLQELAQVPAEQRGAQFKSCVCVWLPDGRHFVWEGVCPGEIGFARKGRNGFGYDPLFIPACVGVDAVRAEPNAEKRTYAELTAAQKDAISHRGMALRAMQAELPELLARTELLGGYSAPCAIYETEKADPVWQEKGTEYAHK